MNSIKMLRLCDNGDIDTITIRRDGDYTELQDMYTAIGRGCYAIETVPSFLTDFPAAVIVDEYGLDKPDAVVNVLASAVTGRRIVGNALYSAIGMVDGETGFIGMTKEQQASVIVDIMRILRSNQ